MVGPALATSPAACVGPGLAAGQDPATAEPLVECGFDRVDAPRVRVLAPDQPIDDHINRSHCGERSCRSGVIEPDHLPGRGDSRKSLGAERLEECRPIGLGADIEREGDLVTRLLG